LVTDIKSLPMFRGKPIGPIFKISWRSKTGLIGFPETSVRIYHSLRNADITYKTAKPEITHSIQSDYLNTQTF
jgi:hypothetical protein